MGLPDGLFLDMKRIKNTYICRKQRFNLFFALSEAVGKKHKSSQFSFSSSDWDALK